MANPLDLNSSIAFRRGARRAYQHTHTTPQHHTHTRTHTRTHAHTRRPLSPVPPTPCPITTTTHRTPMYIDTQRRCSLRVSRYTRKHTHTHTHTHTHAHAHTHTHRCPHTYYTPHLFGDGGSVGHGRSSVVESWCHLSCVSLSQLQNQDGFP
jgi:nuclear factor of activated T-cells 5